MQKPKTQQFSKFFLKDTKNKFPNCKNEKSDVDELNLSSDRE
tara:strand:- start:717 stop:842 length:126 start_codon:yes stop_codon:yes gene_type:complete